MEARIDGHTQLFGLFGSPVGHSGSPVMYNYTFARLGINAAYLAFDVQIDQLPAVIQAVRTLNFGGFNVTMPCKTAIAQYLDELSPAAKLIGAVNTVVVKDGKLIGNNTDGVGFVHNLRENGVDITGKKIVLLGAGVRLRLLPARLLWMALLKSLFSTAKTNFSPMQNIRWKKLQLLISSAKFLLPIWLTMLL